MDMAAKAEAFDLLVEARRKVIEIRQTCIDGGHQDVFAGLKSFSESTREFTSLAEELCDGEISGELEGGSSISTELVAGQTYWMIGEYDNIPVMSQCLLYGDAEDPETVGGDESGNVYVVIEGAEGWDASGYVKREHLAGTDELLAGIRKARSRTL